jgi:hypothetical protein
MKIKLAIVLGILCGALSAFALQAGPYILKGTVLKSNDKTLTIEANGKEAEIPRTLMPKPYQVKKYAKGETFSIALSEAQTKQVKIRKK